MTNVTAGMRESLMSLNLPTETTDRWIRQLREPHRHYHTLDHVAALLDTYCRE